MVKAKRKLYVVRVTHTLEETGSLKDKIIQKLIKDGGEDRLKKFVEFTKLFWCAIDIIMESLNLYKPENASRLHIFMDSLRDPATIIPPSEDDDGELVGVILETAREGIPQSKIIEKMVAQGALLHGTEDYLWWRAYLQYAEDTMGNRDISPQLEILLRQGRDRAIARRINEIIPEGEDGVLFIGKIHEVQIMMELLGFDKSIEIIDVLKLLGAT